MTFSESGSTLPVTITASDSKQFLFTQGNVNIRKKFCSDNFNYLRGCLTLLPSSFHGLLIPIPYSGYISSEFNFVLFVLILFERIYSDENLT